ncbi:guanine-1-methyltransferase-domain-containing protein [Xylariales sp. AK1849]|nr:guanine-1-methyltransferase-domain-containing protein [Xylariales sp. AK1849]
MESTTSGGLETIDAERSEIQSRQTQDHNPEIQPLRANGYAGPDRGVKRGADDNPEDEENGEGKGDDDGIDVEITTGTDKPLSKNQQRKLKRQKVWEEKKQDRVEKRKEKRHNKQERKRLEKEAEIALAAKEGREPNLPRRVRDRDPHKQTKVPVTIILDCQFEKYMLEKELVSLSSQVTRCYSDNRMARYPVHLYVTSYGGQIKERYETVLGGQSRKWKGITFTEDDFAATSTTAKGAMTGPQGGRVIELLQSNKGDSLFLTEIEPDAKPKKNSAQPQAEPELDDVDKSIVYLTADSPYVLDRLEPNTSYVVGGIIDRNRYKGLCYKIARERNVRTAKLPIGEYMVLQDRHVLTTNQVVEIMLRWLELGDWGAAFMEVIPTRKGGKLKDDIGSPDAAVEDEEEKYQEQSVEATR